MTNEQKYKTPEERIRAFGGFCSKHFRCIDCPFYSLRDKPSWCVLKWLALEAEEEKPLPCPYCHKETMPIHIHSDNCFAVKCCMGCGYTSAHTCTEHGAIHNHNELCRKVKGENK